MRKLAKRLVAPEAIEAGLIKPDYWSGPDWVYTDGPAVAEINAKADFPPDPQQQLILDLTFAVDAHWHPAAFSGCVICARQNLKTGSLKQCAVGWLAVTDARKIVWSSHELTTTVDAQNELHELLESSPALSRLLPAQKNRGKYDDNLNKRIELTSGQRVLFKARTVSGGRGLAGDKVILDEALFLKPSHTASLLPIMAARPTGQVLYASSPGLLDSAVLRDVRDRGRAGSSPRMFYVEWGGHWRPCADPDCRHPKDAEARGIDCAADDRELWAKNNPTVSTGRITLERIADLRQELMAEDFIRECMGRWDDPTEGSGPPTLDRRRWTKLKDAEAPASKRAVAVLDVEPDRSMAHIGLAGDGPEGKTLLMSRSEPGTAWIIDGLQRVQKNLENEGGELLEVALHPSGQAGELIPALTAAGFELTKLTFQDLGRGCSTVQSGVDDKTLVHLGQGELDAAVTVARTKTTVHGTQMWDRGQTPVPLGPLVSTSAAAYRYALLTAKPKTPPPAPVALSGPATETRREFDPATVSF